MRLISVPVRLRYATAFLFFCVPIVAIETIIASRASWWRLPMQSLAIWCGSIFLICVPLALWLMNGNKRALRVTQGFAICWCVLTAAIAYKLRHPALGFFTIFLVWYFGGLIVWLRNEMGRSYFDPQLEWFHGKPKPIPGLSCKIHWNGKNEDLRVSRMDKDGTFLFRDGPVDKSTAGQTSLTTLRSGDSIEMEFLFRDMQLKSAGKPMRSLNDGDGAGFQFQGLTPDMRKELGDFVELLRGEGYV